MNTSRFDDPNRGIRSIASSAWIFTVCGGFVFLIPMISFLGLMAVLVGFIGMVLSLLKFRVVISLGLGYHLAFSVFLNLIGVSIVLYFVGLSSFRSG